MTWIADAYNWAEANLGEFTAALLASLAIVLFFTGLIIGIAMAVTHGDREVLQQAGVVTVVAPTASSVGLYRFNDTDAGVTCWKSNAGLSCLRNER